MASVHTTMKLLRFPTFGALVTLALMTTPAARAGDDPPPAGDAKTETPPAADHIKVLEADGGKITLTTARPGLSQRLFLVNAGKAQVVTLTVSDLRDGGGRTVRIDPVVAGPLTFAAYQTRAVELKGTVAEVGEFSGRLALQAGGNVPPVPPDQYTLVVKREKGAQQIGLDAQSDPPAYRLPWPWSTSASVRLRLTETGGEAATFERPELQSLLLTVTDTYKPGAHYSGTRLFSQKTAPAWTGVLEAYGSLGRRLEIDGLRGTGKYEGTIRVATPNGAQTAPFIFFVKDFWAYAALVILAGVWMSYWLRRWFAVGRPQAVAEYQIGRQLQRVQIAIPDVTNAVRRALEVALQDLHRSTLLDATTDIKADLQTANDQLENYLAIESVIALRSQLGVLVPDPTQREALKARLDGLEQRVQDGLLRVLANDAGKNALVEEAKAIRQDVLTGAGQALENAVAALRGNLGAEQAALQAGPLPDADKTSLVQRFKDASDHLTAATAKLTASRNAQGGVDVAFLQQGWQEYEAAKRSYLAASVGRFRSELTAQTTPPLGLSAVEWQSLRDALLTNLPEDSTAEQLAEVRQRYLDGLLGGLAAQAGTEAGTAAPEAAKAALQSVAQAAAAARAKLAAGGEVTPAEVEKLRADYKAAKALLLPANAAIVLESFAVGPEESLRLGGDPASLVGAPRLPPALGTVRPPDDILADIQRHDQLVAWIVSVVSVLVGLQVLWAASSTFGSLIDYIGAFLWGFGLHELNKIAMPDGLAKLGLALPQVKSGG